MSSKRVKKSAASQKVSVPVLRPGEGVLLDNLSPHKAAGVREAIEKAGAQVLYLPPYSPDLQPIEPSWSKVKEFLQAKAARTQETLDPAIDDALDTITPNDAKSFFRKTNYIVH